MNKTQFIRSLVPLSDEQIDIVFNIIQDSDIFDLIDLKSILESDLYGDIVPIYEVLNQIINLNNNWFKEQNISDENGTKLDFNKYIYIENNQYKLDSFEFLNIKRLISAIHTIGEDDYVPQYVKWFLNQIKEL